MTLKYLLIFAICFLVGSAIAIGVRAVVHRPYADATEAHDMRTPDPAKPAPAMPAMAPGHEGHGSAPAPSAAPAPAASANDAKPAQGHDQHGVAPAAAPAGDPTAMIGNTICPSCGMDVDPEIPPVKTAQGSIGIGCAPCVPKIARDPERFAAAARENRKAK